ncbi:unnamed protein product, partial [Durusdinium trenchii]
VKPRATLLANRLKQVHKLLEINAETPDTLKKDRDSIPDIVDLGIQSSLQGMSRMLAVRFQASSDLAIAFNQEVLFDNFFLWSEVFLIFMDSAIRWKTG